MYTCTQSGRCGSVQEKSHDYKTKDSQFLEIELYDVQASSVDHSKFQNLNKTACAMMYAGLICFCHSFMCCKFHCNA